MSTMLTNAVIELERHVAATGWDQPARLFALVDTDELAAAEPGLAQTLGITHVDGGPRTLTPVEQEEFPADQPLDEVLSRIAWPESVSGVALAIERLMLPPEAESEMPADGDVGAWAASHPARRDVRITIGVLRDGEAETVLRMRANDEDDAVLSGPDLVPNLVSALADTLRD